MFIPSLLTKLSLKNGKSVSILQTGTFHSAQVTVSIPFAAWPGELVKLERFGSSGLWRVLESKVVFGEQGYETTLVLGDRNAVL